jgi:hypothetical protein
MSLPISIAKITRPGLAGMGISVTVLWGCLLCERVIVHQATLERAQVLTGIEQLRHQTIHRTKTTPNTAGSPKLI